MIEIRVAAITMALCLAFSCRALSQEHDSIDNECESLRNATPPELVSFLNAVVPDDKNGDCVTWAIKKLGAEHHEPAIGALVRLLGFRRPPTLRERQGIYLRTQGIWEIYPAAGALTLMGEKVLPEVLHAIGADSTSPTARENAIFVWMETYRHIDNPPKGIALLKQEEIKANNDTTKRRLRWAGEKALTWCNSQEQSACRRPATTAASSP